MLDILIPTLEKRKDKFKEVYRELYRQISLTDHKVNIKFICDNGEKKIGEKRNALLDMSSYEGYVAFVDDDDRVSENYIKNLVEGIEKGVDCCSLSGIITVNGKFPKPFFHSIKHNRYYEDNNGYYRFPNHLNCIKSSIAKRFKFQESNHGEDTDWAHQLHHAGVLNVQHDINEVIYFYDYIPNK